MSSENHMSDSETMRSMAITIGVIAVVMASLIIISTSLSGG